MKTTTNTAGTATGMSEKQAERQRPEHRSNGRYAKTNPCYCCGQSAGVEYYSDHRTDTGEFGDVALVLCEACATKGEKMSDADALAFYRAGKRWTREAKKAAKLAK